MTVYQGEYVGSLEREDLNSDEQYKRFLNQEHGNRLKESKMKEILFQGEYKDLKENQLIGKFNTFREGVKYTKSLKVGQIVKLVHINDLGESKHICKAVVIYTFSNKIYNLLAHFSSDNHGVRGESNQPRALKKILIDVYGGKAKNPDNQFTAVGLVRLI